MANDRLDIIIFGATGYTGKYVVENAIQMCRERKMKFGIAGRRKEALDAVVKEFASDIGTEDIPIILADIKDEESLKKMTERARTIITCCGPYRFYGEPVIKACIATRTHYVDVTGEEEFMEEMQLKYNEAAKEAGIYIVSACGFDCIPSDLGIIYTQQNFGGEVNSVEVYMKMGITRTDIKGPYVNYGSWESAIYTISNRHTVKELRKKLYPTKLPEFTPKLKSRGMLHRSDVAKGWSVPFLSADRALSIRTQRFLYDKYKQRPAQIQVYAALGSLFNCLAFSIAFIIFSLMTSIACCRNLLLKYPYIFSGGYISHENPNPKLVESTNFSLTFKARGWTEKLAEPTDKHTNPPNKEVITKISGNSPAYGTTSFLLVLSAITILNETDKMPDNGGVLTPGAAFGKTSLLEQINKSNKYNIKYEVISSTEK